MRGRRTAVVVLLLAASMAGCRDDPDPAPAPTPTTAAPTLAATATLERIRAPRFTGDLEVRVVTGERVSGLGCRQRTDRDACSIDGARTYTWRGAGPTVTVSSARMVPDAGFGTWIVLVRFAPADRDAVQRAADRAGRRGGFVLVLDGHSGSALQAATPIDVELGRITVRDLPKAEAKRLVEAYVTADTAR